MSEKKPQIIIHDDRMWKSILSDVFTFSTLVGPLLLGHFVGSWIIQLVFGTMSILWLGARLGRAHKKSVKTIPEARKYLDELEQSS